jgi:hypothetical protein
MKNKIVIILLGLIIIVGINCKEETGYDYFKRNQNPYFPINIGNEWNYKSGAYYLDIKIKGLVQLDKYYFAIAEENNSTMGDDKPISRTIFYRYDKDKNVLRHIYINENHKYKKELIPNDGVFMWYKFNAKINESWRTMGNDIFFPSEISDYKITLLSKSDTIIANNKKYFDCCKFHIVALSSSDSDYYEWFAKDIGLVKRCFLNESNKGFLLQSYKN